MQHHTFGCSVLCALSCLKECHSAQLQCHGNQHTTIDNNDESNIRTMQIMLSLTMTLQPLTPLPHTRPATLINSQNWQYHLTETLATQQQQNYNSTTGDNADNYRVVVDNDHNTTSILYPGPAKWSRWLNHHNQ